jgi:hypothetical protein
MTIKGQPYQLATKKITYPKIRQQKVNLQKAMKAGELQNKKGVVLSRTYNFYIFYIGSYKFYLDFEIKFENVS